MAKLPNEEKEILIATCKKAERHAKKAERQAERQTKKAERQAKKAARHLPNTPQAENSQAEHSQANRPRVLRSCLKVPHNPVEEKTEGQPSEAEYNELAADHSSTNISPKKVSFLLPTSEMDSAKPTKAKQNKQNAQKAKRVAEKAEQYADKAAQKSEPRSIRADKLNEMKTHTQTVHEFTERESDKSDREITRKSNTPFSMRQHFLTAEPQELLEREIPKDFVKAPNVWYKGDATKALQFLELPGEIRNKIYGYVLIYNDKIELAPNEYDNAGSKKAEQSRKNLLGAETKAERAKADREWEQLKKERKDLCLNNKTVDSEWIDCDGFDTIKTVQLKHPYFTQRSVRLLRVCKQVYNEAINIFWENNTFAFSYDLTWTILYRFLTTIGPDARQRIRYLQACIPLQNRWSPPKLFIHEDHRPALRLDRVPKMEKPWHNARYVSSMLKSEDLDLHFLLTEPWGFCGHTNVPELIGAPATIWRRRAPFYSLESLVSELPAQFFTVLCRQPVLLVARRHYEPLQFVPQPEEHSVRRIYDPVDTESEFKTVPGRMRASICVGPFEFESVACHATADSPAASESQPEKVPPSKSKVAKRVERRLARILIED